MRRTLMSALAIGFTLSLLVPTDPARGASPPADPRLPAHRTEVPRGDLEPLAASNQILPRAYYGDHAVLVGHWPQRADVRSVEIAGSITYVVESIPPGDFGIGGASFLKIVDLSDTDSPEVLSDTLRVGGPNRGSVLSGGYLFLTDGGGLQIVDVADPRNPRIASSYYNFGGFEVAVSGSWAYLATGRGLDVVDISDPSLPTRVGTFRLSGLLNVAVSGSYAFVLDPGRDLLRVFDVSTPTAPILAVSYPFAWTYTAHIQIVTDASGRSYAYAGQDIIDVTNPLAPTRVGAAPSAPNGMRIVGTEAFLVDGYSLEIYDISDPVHPRFEGSTFQPPNCPDITFASFGPPAILGARAYAPEGNAGLRIIDISDHAAPMEIGALDHGTTRDVAIAGHHAYVADDYAGLRILDISDPSQPVEVGAIDTPDWAWHVAVQGTHAYVGSPCGSLRVIDVADPADPQEIGSLGDQVFSMAVSGSRLYFNTGSTLKILDLADPAHPAPLGAYGAPYGQPSGVVAAGTQVYLAGYGGFRVLDVSDPYAPMLLGSLDESFYTDVAVAGSRAYVTALSDAYVHALDVSDPMQPAEVGACPTFGQYVQASGDQVWVNGAWYSSSGVEVADLSAPSDCKSIARLQLSGGRTYHSALANGYFHMTAGKDGLYIIALDSDNDRVADQDDLCAESIITPTLMIGSCDTGVPNTVFSDGCTIADQLATCEEGEANPGQVQVCMTRLLDQMRDEGTITPGQRGRIERCPARTSAPGCRIQGAFHGAWQTNPLNSCEICSPDQDATHWTVLEDYSYCEDGNPCTYDQCQQGVCVTYEEANCDDGDACTIDYCDPDAAICVNDPVGGACATGPAPMDPVNDATGSPSSAPVSSPDRAAKEGRGGMVRK